MYVIDNDKEYRVSAAIRYGSGLQEVQFKCLGIDVKRALREYNGGRADDYRTGIVVFGTANGVTTFPASNIECLAVTLWVDAPEPAAVLPVEEPAPGPQLVVDNTTAVPNENSVG